MLLNARSINNKVYQLTELLLEENVDICCITETWLKEGDDPTISSLKREGYNVISCPRDVKRGGGIAFLNKSNKFKTKRLKTSKYRMFEILEVLLIGENSNNNIRFSIICRTGYMDKDDQKIFVNEFNNFLETIITKNSTNLICGDFNLKLETHGNTSNYFIDLMETKGFKQIITSSTHVEGGLLDLVFVTDINLITNLNILENKAISDHFPIKFNIMLPTVKMPSHFEIMQRNFSKINLNIFKSNVNSKMKEVSKTIVNDKYNLDNLVNLLDKGLLTELNNHAPLVKKRIRITNHIVKNQKIQDARRLKRRAENKFKKTKSEDHKIQLKLLRKNLSRIVKESRNQFFIDKFSQHKGNIKQTYKIINLLINKNQEKIFPDHLNEKVLADDFAKFYKQKIDVIRNSLHIVKCPEFVIKPVFKELLEFRAVTVSDIIDVIKSLPNKQSSLDPIPCNLVKLCQSELSLVFKKVINSSFKLGAFPNSLKVATVTPIIKSSRLDSELFNSYRPISNLTILSKLLEKCVLNQLVDHLNINNLYCELQSAYRPGHSCETALMKIHHDTLNYLSSTTYAVLVFLDFSAAFDTIDHDILLKRLKFNFGINHKALDWFSSYLQHRSYKVKINNTLSDGTKLNYGVPQGSILGPILFSLYITEINNIISSHNLSCHFYADDIQIYLKCDNNTDFKNLINCLEQINEWTSCNYLRLNSSKTKIMAVYPQNYRQTKITELNIMGETIKVENTVKNLGFTIDKNLRMDKQINQVCSQGYFMLRRLWKISDKVTNISLRTQLVHSGILSKIDYCNSLYASLPNIQIKKLQKLINSSARFIFNIKGKARFQHITPKLQQLHFLPMEYRIKFKICLMVYKTINNINAPLYLQQLINTRKPIINRSLRIDHDKLILTCKTPEKQNYKNRSFSFTAPSLWNQLPINVRESPTVSLFKNSLKTFYFSEWTKSIIV